MCRVLHVSRSGFYAWQKRSPSASAGRRSELGERIRQVHQQSRAIYGAPRVHRDLAAADVRCSKNTVAKLMRKAALDQAWAADITYIRTGEGWLYLAAVIDLCSRKIVGWATSDSLAAEVSCRALEMALTHRRPRGPLLHHSDRGVQYACDDYQRLLAKHGLTASMSRTGNCYDNAVIESFFGTLKTELVHHETYPTREIARQSLFEYIEVFYNRQRRHSTLGYVSPHEYEQHFAAAKLSGGLNVDNPTSKQSELAIRDRARPGKGLAGRQPSTSGTTLIST